MASPRASIINRSIAKIPLGVGAKDGYAIVDKEFAWLDEYLWTKATYDYPTTTVGKKTMWMHKLIMAPPQGMTVDHINGNRLDNRSANLRVCTLYQNNLNKEKTVRNTTGYKGVDFFKQYGKYRARVKFNKKEYHLGYFDSAIEAAKAYNKKAYELHGEFARLNHG